MIPRGLRWIAMGAVVVAAATACSSAGAPEATLTPTPSGTKGGTLRLAVPVSPATTGWDPVVADPATQRVVGPAVMATLLRPDPAGGAPTPWLAESVTSDESARVWTIVLREGLTFSDGAALTSADVVFMLEEAAANPNLSTRFGTDGKVTWFKSAVAKDARTVVLTVQNGNASLDRLVLAAPEFGCISQGYRGLPRSEYYRRPASCGPFTIAPGQEGSRGTVRLVRNDRYFAAAGVLLDGITISAGSRAQREADVALDVGPGVAPVSAPTTAASTSVAPTTPVSPAPTRTTTPPAPTSTDAPTATASTAATPSATRAPAPRRWTTEQVVTSEPGVSAVLVLRNDAPTSDANLRQALKASIDYGALLRAAPGAVAPSSGLTPAGWSGGVAVPPQEQRLDIATLAANLVPEDARSLTLLVNRSDGVAQQRAAQIVADAERAGITIVLDERGAGDVAKAVAQGRFDAVLLDVAPTAAVAAEVSRLWAWTGGFAGRWSPEPGRAAYAVQLTRPQDVDRAAAATARFEDINRRAARVLPLASDPHRIGVAPRVVGASVGPEGSIPLERISLTTGDGDRAS